MTSLPILRLTVTMPGGQVHTVALANPDLVRWDLTRARHRWPDVTEAPFLWQTFCAWAACKRLGLTTLEWETFSETVESVTDAPGEAADVDPSHAGPAPAY